MAGFIFSLATVNTALSQQVNEEIRWFSLEAAQELAIQNERKILVFAETQWCVYCKKMKREVFTQNKVINLLNRYFYAVKIDIESDKSIKLNGETMTESQFAEKYDVQVPPVLFVINNQGQFLSGFKGFMSKKVLTDFADFVGTEMYKESSFQEFISTK